MWILWIQLCQINRKETNRMREEKNLQFTIKLIKLNSIARFFSLLNSKEKETKYKQTSEIIIIIIFYFVLSFFLVSDLENNVIETENAHTQFQREQWAQIRANSIFYSVCDRENRAVNIK